MLQLGLNDLEDGGDCFVGMNTTFLLPGVADMTDKIGNEGAPVASLVPAVPCEEPHIESAVKAVLCDPGAQHLHRSLITLRSRRNDERRHDFLQVNTSLYVNPDVRPNVELTGAPRCVARAVRRNMDKGAARPWTHAVGRPVERNVRLHFACRTAGGQRWERGRPRAAEPPSCRK